jgi:tRNA A-37 threonylcarbamoyl transferase component Bud32
MSTTVEQHTLALRMAEGKIPVSEALHYAMSLAEALRKLHDAGKAHGAVTPTSIVLSGTGVELIASLGPLATVTPYTAPEVLQGETADSRSDIFSFGAIVFEMLTGRRAFDGENQTELKLALSNAAPPPSGSPSVDRLVTACVAKAPSARWQRMQKIILELKLLTVAARRAETPAPARGAAESALRAEIQQLEARLSARLANYEKTAAATQKTAAESVENFKEHIAGIHMQLAALQDRPVPAPVDVEALRQQIQGRLEETIAAVAQQLRAQMQEAAEAAKQHSAQAQEAMGSVKQELAAQTAETAAGLNQRMAAGEQNMEEIRKHFATLQANVAGDLHDFEKTLKVQGVAIDSARTAMAQTDDLVERVVEALELLQSSMIDQHESAGVN